MGLHQHYRRKKQKDFLVTKVVDDFEKATVKDIKNDIDMINSFVKKGDYVIFDRTQYFRVIGIQKPKDIYSQVYYELDPVGDTCLMYMQRIKNKNKNILFIEKGDLISTVEAAWFVYSNVEILREAYSRPGNENFNIPVEKLGFSNRVYNSLIRANCFTLGDITVRTERDLATKGKNLGKKGFAEIYTVLEKYGLGLTECDPFDWIPYEELMPF